MYYNFNNNRNRYPLPPVLKPMVKRQNPTFTKNQFLLYIPAMKQFVETEQGDKIFQEYKSIANGKVYKSMMGDEWKLAMSLCIAHYIAVWANNASLAERGGGGNITSISALGKLQGVITSQSVGEISKSYDFSLTTPEKTKDSIFWMQSEYGKQFYSIWSVKQPFSIAVVGGSGDGL